MKTYDRDYFDRYYRAPDFRITTAAELRRRASMVLGIAETLLGHSVRSVLDIGCGEGRWLAILRKLRPGAKLMGLETSDYAVTRFGRSRNISRGSFGSLEDLAEEAFDLVLCVDVLHYLRPAEIDRGLHALPSLVGGIAYLDVTTREDKPEGDLEGWISRPASWYARRFEEAGLQPVGMMCWAGAATATKLGAMETRVSGRR